MNLKHICWVLCKILEGLVDSVLLCEFKWITLVHITSYGVNFIQDAEDLSFKKGDVLIVVEQNEEKWWTAINEQGQKGLIPEPYVKKVWVMSLFDSHLHIFTHLPGVWIGFEVNGKNCKLSSNCNWNSIFTPWIIFL